MLMNDGCSKAWTGYMIAEGRHRKKVRFGERSNLVSFDQPLDGGLLEDLICVYWRLVIWACGLEVVVDICLIETRIESRLGTRLSVLGQHRIEIIVLRPFAVRSLH